MEADWTAEISPDLPCITVPWDGFIDLRDNPSAVFSIEEAAVHAALREALHSFNSSGSRVFTAKCDLWQLSQSEIDPDEFASSPEHAHHGTASYIDLLRRDLTTFSSFEFHECWARTLTSLLRSLDILHGRVELVLRPSVVNQHPGFGLTLYAAGCGATPADAYTAWQSVLAAAVAATISTSTAAIQPVGE